MLRFPLPAALHGDALIDELAAAGFDAEVAADGDELVVTGPGEGDRAAVQSVIDAHIPPATVDHEAEFSNAVTAIDTSKISDAATKAALDAIKAVLSGGKGPGAEPRRGA